MLIAISMSKANMGILAMKELYDNYTCSFPFKNNIMTFGSTVDELSAMNTTQSDR